MIGIVLLCVSLGATWAVVGVIMSHVAAKQMSVANFYFLGAAILTPLAFLVSVDWSYLPSEGLTKETMLSCALVFGLGLFTALGQACVVGAMRRGLHAPAYALGQSAVIFPFIAAALFGLEQRALLEWCGLGMILVGVGVLAQVHPGSAVESGVSLAQRQSYSWSSAVLALAGMCLLGLGQVLGLLPSIWLPRPDPAGLRLPILMLSMALSYWVIGRLKARPFTSGNFGLALIWSAVAGASYVLLFYTLDYAASHNLAGLVFPLAIGANILLFTGSVRFWRHERMSLHLQLGILGIVGGLTLMVASVLFSVD